MARHIALELDAPEGDAPVLEVSDLCKVYGARGRAARSRGAATRALDGITFGVAAGEFVAIMGPSGSGKSTLLNCIATIDAPTSGSVRIAGQDVGQLPRRDLADFRRTQLGFVFQDANLLDTLTARENVALPLTIGRVDPDETRQRVDAMAQTLGVADVLDKYPYEMSGGQRQRVACARALVTRPRLVLADEPTGALDTQNSRVLLESLGRLNRAQRVTILMVTHDVTAASYCQRAVFIRDGRLLAELRRGGRPRQEFFEQIMQVVAVEGGVDDAR